MGKLTRIYSTLRQRAKSDQKGEDLEKQEIEQELRF